MTSHNSQVTANIAEINARVEKATSQDELVTLIRDVENHSGPLDYDDTHYRIYTWAHLILGILIPICIFFWGFLGAAVTPVYWVIHYSSFWLPLWSLYILWAVLDDRNKRLPLPTIFDTSWARIAVLGVLAVGLWFLYEWHILYWEYFNLLSMLLGFYENYAGLSVHLLIIGGLLWFWLRGRAKWRDPVSEKIFLLDALFNNDLKPVKCDGKGLAKTLGEEFAEFIRGNDIRQIKDLYQGKFEGEEHSFEYQLYCFHYVKKRTETYTDAKGNTQTRTVRDHFYRHGFIVDFPYVKSLSLDADRSISFRGEKYRGTSNEFNRIFKVKAADPISAARLLSPVLEEQLVTFAKAFKSPTLEISSRGRLCVAVQDNLLSLKRKHGLENPGAFAEEIAGHTELKEVQKILDLLHELMRYTDNNFTAETPRVSA
ncbi:DUF3137 domain-containing protein [Litoribrevibacter euphylliae]|uniref:DUF3137 domain-containing protein n=1 Tax=Litoribrevibacter euphylliae TaxID=1834034 RepID=A0ABV7HMT0_9GAMM